MFAFWGPEGLNMRVLPETRAYLCCSATKRRGEHAFSVLGTGESRVVKAWQPAAVYLETGKTFPLPLNPNTVSERELREETSQRPKALCLCR